MSTKASAFFNTNPYGAATEVNSVGAGSSSGLTGLLYTGQGVSIGQSTADDNWRDLLEITDQAGIINLLWYASVIFLYTSGDVFKIRLTVDGVVVCTSQVTIDADDKGAVVIGGVTYDGSDYRPMACGFIPFTDSFKVEQQVLRAGASSIPNVLISYVKTD